MSILKRFKAVRGYLAYRVQSELEYLRQFSPTFRYYERTYRWWRYNFPEYILPSSLPNPPGTPPTQPTWLVAPLPVLLQRIPVWEMQLDNILLFGHAMPTNAEVEYRRAYLQWADDAKRGLHRPLPVEAIIEDTRRVRVPVYEYPFVHEELWEFAAARARAVAARALPVLRIQPPLDLPPLPRHWRNFVMVRDADGLWDVVRPAQLLLPVEVAEGDGAVDGSPLDRQAAAGGAARERSAADGGAEMREAAADMRAAATDAWHIVGVARASATSLAPMALEFARDRIDTLRTALAEFMQGYTQGTREVEGGTVDVAEDARQFYQRMLHTLPDALASLDERLQPPPAPAERAPAEGNPRDQPLSAAAPRTAPAGGPRAAQAPPSGGAPGEDPVVAVAAVAEVGSGRPGTQRVRGEVSAASGDGSEVDGGERGSGDVGVDEGEQSGKSSQHGKGDSGGGSSSGKGA